MRLKKLVLSGFKSFADRTTLHFDAGITCIVGPNGCGKSNISDAFRWVLGEQSAKSLRGNKMPDIIFSGTNSRKPLNVAEVSLVLTDIQGKLPIEYEEVTLTRRLHRNGESEYLLNGNQVRLKDLQNLFLDSGIGRNAFSIFEQGKLDQVINYSSFERRYIFEEAAGILRFLQRKREALKRLDQADHNLSRVRDVHQEVEKQILLLKDQAEKARSYKQNKDLLENLEKVSYVLRWDFLEKKWEDASIRKQKLLTHLENHQHHLKDFQEGQQRFKIVLQVEEKNLRTKSEELFTIRNAKEIENREQQSIQQRIQENQQKEKKIRREIEDLKSAQQTHLKAINALHEKRKKIEVDFTEAETGISSYHSRIKHLEKEVLQLRQDLQLRQQQRVKKMQEESSVSSEYKQHETRLENNQERQKILEEKKITFLEEEKKLQDLVLEKKNQLSAISVLIDSHKKHLQEYEEGLKAAFKEIEAKQKELDFLKKRVVEQRARQKVLLRLREDREGFSSGSKKLLKESQDPKSALYNKIRPLYEFFDPHSDTAEAMAVILRHYTQTLVVETEQDLKIVLEYTGKEKILDYSLFCLAHISKEREARGFFHKKIIHNNIAKHFLTNIEEAKNNEETLSLINGSKEVWSLLGVYVDSRKVFFHIKANENQVFLRENELRSLDEELLKKEEECESLDKHLQHLIGHKSKIQTARSELDSLLRKEEMKLVEINVGLQRGLSDQDKNKNEKIRFEKDSQALALHLEQQKENVKKLREGHFKLKEGLSMLQHEIGSIELELEKKVSALRILQNDQKKKGDYFKQVSEDRHQLIHQLNVFEVQIEEYRKQEKHFIDELKELSDIQANLNKQSPRFQDSLEKIEKNLNQATVICSQLEDKIKILKEDSEKNDKELSLTIEVCRKTESELNQWSLQEVQHRSAGQSLEHELQERYQLSLSEAKKLAMPENKSLDQIEKQMRSLRAFLQNIGAINMAAIEELEKNETRHSFLKQQVDDMTVSKEELLQIIHEMETESRKLFRKTFDAVRENFKKNFQILFNGGEADLQFTDSDNILEAGIEIIAKPPGKQMRAISLLSGGEKCLTAVALLFAIFEFKPAPFCILDEIDAPLDDTNVERFTNVVKHFMERCQFLIITHNKRTMAIGNRLFGVSMEEKGVSKLLALEFSNEEAPETHLIEK